MPKNFVEGGYPLAFRKIYPFTVKRWTKKKDNQEWVGNKRESGRIRILEKRLKKNKRKVTVIVGHFF